MLALFYETTFIGIFSTLSKVEKAKIIYLNSVEIDKCGYFSTKEVEIDSFSIIMNKNRYLKNNNYDGKLTTETLQQDFVTVYTYL